MSVADTILRSGSRFDALLDTFVPPVVDAAIRLGAEARVEVWVDPMDSRTVVQLAVAGFDKIPIARSDRVHETEDNVSTALAKILARKLGVEVVRTTAVSGGGL